MEGGTDHDLRVLDDETKGKQEGSTSDDGAVSSDTSIGKLVFN
jgi:hypothetical protein